MKATIRILVTGAQGQLGSEIKEIAAQYPNCIFTFTDRAELSITDKNAVDRFFEDFQPDYCINCAAYTAVDKAEDPEQRGIVEAVNAIAVEYLAAATAKYHAKLIHISTDYVFSGKATLPYKETDTAEPVSIYGITKLKGEQLALANTDAVVIRTAWVYSSYGKNFVKTMINLMQSKPQLKVVSDQYGTPTYAADLAKVIMQMINSGKWIPGIYHYTNEGNINWYEFALAIKDIINATCEIKAIPTIEYPTPAKRPAWGVLDKSKIKEAYHIFIPDWHNSLETCIQKIQRTNNS